MFNNHNLLILTLVFLIYNLIFIKNSLLKTTFTLNLLQVFLIFFISSSIINNTFLYQNIYFLILFLMSVETLIVAYTYFN